MTDRISFPPLLDLSPAELHMARERLLSVIKEGVKPRSPLTRMVSRRAVLAGGVAVVVAAAAISIPLVLGSSGASRHSSPPSRGRPRLGHPLEPGAPSTVSVSSVEEANAHLPFKVVLPSNATPTGGIQVPISGKPSDSSGALTADFDTDEGSYLLSEHSSDATVGTLQHWAAEPCGEGCTTQQLVTEDGVHVLVVESSVFGLRLQWLRGDGASPVMTELDWSTDMPANNTIPSEKAALAIARDIIRQGG